MTLTDEIGLKADASEAARLNAWLDQKYAVCNVDSKVAHDLRLCLNEIMANLISYAFKDTAQPCINVALKLQPLGAIATISDNGGYFDLRGWRSLPAHDPLKGRLGGFGIALVKEHASRIDYTSTNGVNRLTIECGIVTP